MQQWHNLQNCPYGGNITTQLKKLNNSIRQCRHLAGCVPTNECVGIVRCSCYVLELSSSNLKWQFLRYAAVAASERCYCSPECSGQSCLQRSLYCLQSHFRNRVSAKLLYSYASLGCITVFSFLTISIAVYCHMFVLLLE